MVYERWKRVLSLSINVSAAILETAGLIMGIALYWEQYGRRALLYYTQLSNLLAFAATVIMAVEECRDCSVPRGIQFVEYTAVSMLSLTFFVNLFVLVPLAGWDSLYNKLFSSTKLFHRLLCRLMMTNFHVFRRLSCPWRKRQRSCRYTDALLCRCSDRTQCSAGCRRPVSLFPGI